MNTKQREEMMRVICALYYLKCDVYNHEVQYFVNNFVKRNFDDVTEQTYFGERNYNINNQFVITEHQLTKEFLNAYRNFKNIEYVSQYYADIISDRWCIEKFIVKAIMYINNFYEDYSNSEIKTEIRRYVNQGITVDSTDVKNIQVRSVSVNSVNNIIINEYYSHVFDCITQNNFYSAFTGKYEVILSEKALNKIKTYLSCEDKCPKILREDRQEIFLIKDRLELYNKKKYTKSIFIIPLTTKACIINGVVVEAKDPVSDNDDSFIITTHNYGTLNDPKFKEYNHFLVKEDNTVHHFNGYTFIQDHSKIWNCENV